LFHLSISYPIDDSFSGWVKVTELGSIDRVTIARSRLVSITNILIMLNKNPKGEEESKLNFYSKYNRVKDKQDISTLYSLLDDA
jgi:hypothetical protein